jgi:putative membrane protein
MIGPVAVAWIHYVAVMLMMASLLGEHLLLKPEMAPAQTWTVQRLDIVYGASATLVLVTGVMRMYLEKGATYYLHNGPFHALLCVFVVAALLSIYPTVVFLRWRTDTRAGRGQQLAPERFRRLQMILRTELALVLLAPLFATWMAHGPLY